MYKFEPLTAVVLVDNNMGIGSGSDILFHCRPFREQQMRILANHPVIMGRNTYESFPWEKVPPVLNSRILCCPVQPGQMARLRFSTLFPT